MDKDGLILGLLAAEITAKTGQDPGEAYDDLTKALGKPFYERIDAPATQDEKDTLATLSPGQLAMTDLGGEPVQATLNKAPGNGIAFGGLKVIAKTGWFALRPSGTEDVYKIYAESFRSEDHLRQIQHEAQDAVATLFGFHGEARTVTAI
jgi:phosphoglucomutase